MSSSAFAFALDAAAIGRCRAFAAGRAGGFSRLEAGYLLARHALLLAFFDQAHMGFAAGVHQADGEPAFARAAGAADAVGIVVGGARQVVVDHCRQLLDVQPACRNVGGDHHS
jgi:hypothetical protein